MNLAAINAELARIGYRAVKLPKPRATKGRYMVDSTDDELSKLKAWKPETPAGRACKSNMLYWRRMPASRPSKLVPLLALFGKTLGDVQPWPHITEADYSPALLAAHNTPNKLLTFDKTGAACRVFADATTRTPIGRFEIRESR